MSELRKLYVKLQLHTLSNVTRSAACNKVNFEMSSTILLMRGSLEVAEEVEVLEDSTAAVARYLEWVSSRDQLSEGEFTVSNLSQCKRCD